MSDKKLMIGDDMVETQLNEKSKKLGLSIDELIERYILRGLYCDDYYRQPKLSKEKIKKIFKIDENSLKTPPEDNHMDSLVGIYKYSKE